MCVLWAYVGCVHVRCMCMLGECMCVVCAMCMCGVVYVRGMYMCVVCASVSYVYVPGMCMSATRDTSNRVSCTLDKLTVS